jgi:hypothetical protein
MMSTRTIVAALGAAWIWAALAPTAHAANLALNRPVVASSTESATAFPATAAVDGNAGTRWSSSFADNQWIYVDLGAVRSLTSVILQWEAAYATAYHVDLSNDAATWTTSINVTNGAGGTVTLNFPANTSARYVRLWGVTRATQYGISVWEFDVEGSTATPTSTARPTATVTSTATATTPPTTNLALNRPATASSSEAVGTTANLAVDGNTTSRWSSAFSDPQWIYVDLGSTRTISRVVLNWEAAYATAYQIQTSNDAVTWTTIFSTTTGDGGIDDLAVSGSGRYVRMYGTARATPYGYSLWEFEVYGSSGPTATATATSRPGSTPTFTATATRTSTATATRTATSTATTQATPTSVTCSTNTNIALNKPAYSSFYQDAAHAPKYAVDGTRDGGTADNRWASAWMPTAWLTIDLGAVATIRSVQLYWESAYAANYDIQVSNNNTTWTTVTSVAGNTSQTNVLNFASPASGRYIRMNGTARRVFDGGYQYGYSLYEFEVYGCGDNPNVTPTPTPGPLAGNYVLVWSDEFDGTALDQTKWSYDPGLPQNGEAETYTTDSQNVRVAGGMLTLEAHDTNESHQACNGCRFTSGRINSKGKKTFKYGRMAARMRLPVADGMWPAFWGLGSDIDTNGWPNCGEIDVMENIGYSNWVSSALHGPGYFGAGSVGAQETPPSTVGDWHEYRVDWDPTYTQFYIDGALMFTANRADIESTRGMWVYDHDFFLILNLAMGGDYPQGYNGETGAVSGFAGLPLATINRLPLRVDVDYVRVYQKQ